MAPWSAAAVISGLVSFFIALSNLVVLAGVLKKWVQGSKDFRVIDTTDSIILQIAFADFVYGLLRFTAHALSGGEISSSASACRLSAANIFTTPLFSILALVLLAYYRYSVIKDEKFSVGLSFKKTSIIAGILWVYCFAFGIPYSFAGVPAPSNLYCRPESSMVVGVIVSLAVFGPSITIFVLYYKITQFVKESSIDQKLPRSVAKMIFAINLVYVVSLFPYGATGIYMVIVGRQSSRVLDSVTTIVASLNYAANPILYCIFQKKYRRAIVDLVGIKFLMNPSTTEDSISGGQRSQIDSTTRLKTKSKASVNGSSIAIHVSPMNVEPSATTTKV